VDIDHAAFEFLECSAKVPLVTVKFGDVEFVVGGVDGLGSRRRKVDYEVPVKDVYWVIFGSFNYVDGVLPVDKIYMGEPTRPTV
jgi:hypothetical protein